MQTNYDSNDFFVCVLYIAKGQDFEGYSPTHLNIIIKIENRGKGSFYFNQKKNAAIKFSVSSWGNTNFFRDAY